MRKGKENVKNLEGQWCLHLSKSEELWQEEKASFFLP